MVQESETSTRYCTMKSQVYSTYLQGSYRIKQYRIHGVVGFESPKLHQKIPSKHWGFSFVRVRVKSPIKSLSVHVFVLFDDSLDFVLRILGQFANDSAQIVKDLDGLVFAVTRVPAHAGVPAHAVARCVHASACVRCFVIRIGDFIGVRSA